MKSNLQEGTYGGIPFVLREIEGGTGGRGAPFLVTPGGTPPVLSSTPSPFMVRLSNQNEPEEGTYGVVPFVLREIEGGTGGRRAPFKSLPAGTPPVVTSTPPPFVVRLSNHTYAGRKPSDKPKGERMTVLRIGLRLLVGTYMVAPIAPT